MTVSELITKLQKIEKIGLGGSTVVIYGQYYDCGMDADNCNITTCDVDQCDIEEDGRIAVLQYEGVPYWEGKK